MFKKNEFEKAKRRAIEEIKSNDSFILSSDGVVITCGEKINVYSDITLFITKIYECLPKQEKIMILAGTISQFKKEKEISDESEELAKKVVEGIEKLK